MRNSHEDYPRVGPGRHMLLHEAPAALVSRALSRVPRRRVPVPLLALTASLVAGAAGLVIGAVWDSAPSEEEEPAQVIHGQDLVGVQLALYRPGAERVGVAGSWNEWDATQTPLSRTPDGLFHGWVMVPRGRQEYMFVADGTWVTDESAPLWHDDGFGHRNAVLEL